MKLISPSTEKLFRAVFPTVFWDDETNKPSSSIFKDKRGVSVDREGGRNLDEVKYALGKSFGAKLRGIISIETLFCYEQLRVLVFEAPLPNNEYHAEIHRSREIVVLTDSQAKQLVKHCQVIM